MAFIDTKSKFHVALDGVGLILQNAPDRLGYEQNEAPIYGNRFASGDRSYNDFSKWWYFVQTDWSGGFKDFLSWADDAKFYYSTNIDAFSEVGAIKLAKKLALQETFTENIFSGGEGEINGTVKKFIGTDLNAGGEPVVYLLNGSWVDITSTPLAWTDQKHVIQLFTRLGRLWMFSIFDGGTGGVAVVASYDGANWEDYSSDLQTAAGFLPQNGHCAAMIGSDIYVFMGNQGLNKYALMRATIVNPAASGDWTKLLEIATTDFFPVDCINYGGDLYYLVCQGGTFTQLRMWDVSAATDNLVYTFRNTNFKELNSIGNGIYGMAGRMLHVLGGKLVITIPDKEVWDYDLTTMRKIYRRDDNKNDIGKEAVAHLQEGGVLSDNRIHWGNLIYNGSSFYNSIKETTDSTSFFFYPLFTSIVDDVWGVDTNNTKKLYKVDSAAYKGTADKNFLVFSNHDVVSGVDKLAYSLTIVFKPLISGQTIKIEYFTGELTSSSSFTSLGNVNFTDDGGTITDKTLLFGTNITFKKIWVRVKVEGGGSDTPSLKDVVMEYLPIPTASKLWNLNINCGDEVKTLDGSSVETTGRELKSRLEVARWTKEILDFQDLDYATTTLDGALNSSDTTVNVIDTKDFPEQGRLKVDDEEMFYTGKTPKTFTGVTRGARDTRAASHSSGVVINNGYKVIVTDLVTRIPIALEDKNLEYVVGISLRET